MKRMKKAALVVVCALMAGNFSAESVWAADFLPQTSEAAVEYAAQDIRVSGVEKAAKVETAPEGETISKGETTPEETKNNDKKTVKKPPVKLNKKKIQLKIKKKKKLTVKNYKGKVKWSSSKKNVAEVSPKGVITAKGPGDVVITAKAGTKTLKCKVRVVESTAHLSQWVEKNGRCYYYNCYGVKVTGRKTIKGKEYLFDSDGRQRVGWNKVKGSYYFYKIAPKTKGYRVAGKKIDGITLQKDGKAKLTDDTKNKAKYLAEANAICFDYVNFNMSKKQQLEKMFTLMAECEIISYRNYGHFKYSKNWDQDYAAYYFNKGIGDCYTAGCAFAYMATALGYDEVYAESSGGHGWCRIGKKYYDPDWAFWGVSNIMDAFGATGTVKGKYNSMNWGSSCKYAIKIS